MLSPSTWTRSTAASAGEPTVQPEWRGRRPIRVLISRPDLRSEDEGLGLLGRVDHLAQQEAVTLHRRVWPPPGPRP